MSMEQKALQMCNRLFEQKSTHIDLTSQFKQLVKSMQNGDNLCQVHGELLAFERYADKWLGEVLHILHDISDMKTDIESEMDGQDTIPAQFYLKVSAACSSWFLVEPSQPFLLMNRLLRHIVFNSQASVWTSSDGMKNYGSTGENGFCACDPGEIDGLRPGCI